VLEVRTETEDRVLAHLLEHARTLESGRALEAVSAYQRILQLNATCEAALEGLIRAYTVLGDQKNRRLTEVALQNMLKREYGISVLPRAGGDRAALEARRE
jgi:two-component SAPR family response regulator